MGLQFGVDDEEEFGAARDALVDGFESAGGSADDGWVAHQLLHFKWGYLDGHLGRWTASDLSEVLLELFPRKVIVEAEDIAGVVPAAARFVDYLAERGLLAPDGHPLPRLHAALDEIGAEFPRVMADTSRYGMAKSLFAPMADAGSDPSDPDALGDWVAAHNALPYEERLAATGGPDLEMPDLEMPELEVLELPPLAPTDPAALAAAAQRSQLLTWAAQFVDFVGDGRALTQKGNLTLADGRHLVAALETGDRMDKAIRDQVFKTKSTTELRELDFVFRWSRAAGFVKVRKGRVEATRAAGQLSDDPFAAWHRGFDGLLELGVIEQRWKGARYLVPPWAAEIDSNVPGLLLAAYALREGVPVESLTETMWDAIRSVWAVDDLPPSAHEQWRESAEDDVRLVLRRFAQLGALEVTGVVEEPTGYGSSLERGGNVTLTPLGLAAVQRLAEQHGMTAPLAGQHRHAGAATLLKALTDASESVIDAEAAAWVAARDPAEAAAEVAAALTGDAEVGGGGVVGGGAVGGGAVGGGAVAPQLLAIGLTVLDVIGPDAEEAVRGLADDPALAPYAALWLTVHDLPAPDVDPGAVLAALAVIDAEGVVERLVALGPPAVQIAVIDDVRGHRWPGADALFQAVAADHPDKTISKAARRALFRLRSGPRR